MKKIACVGGEMIELSPIVRDTAHIGVAGDTFNTAVYLRRSLPPATADVAYVSALGDEAMSARFEQALRDEALSRVAGAHGHHTQ